METGELAKRLVLGKICDDYENVDQTIAAEVIRDGARLGLWLDRAEIVNILTALVSGGYARAYLLRDPGRGPEQIEGMPNIDIPEKHFCAYFLATEKGIEFNLSGDSWWPFD